MLVMQLLILAWLKMVIKWWYVFLVVKTAIHFLIFCWIYNKSAPIKFDIVAVNLDQKQPGFPEHVLPEYLQSIGVDYKIVEENTYGIVKEKIPEGKQLALSALVYAVVFYTVRQLNLAQQKLHLDTIVTICWLPCSWICSTVGN